MKVHAIFQQKREKLCIPHYTSQKSIVQLVFPSTIVSVQKIYFHFSTYDHMPILPVQVHQYPSSTAEYVHLEKDSAFIRQPNYSEIFMSLKCKCLS